MRRAVALFFFGVLHSSVATAMALDEEKPEIFGAHYGYTFAVKDERNKRDIEMVMLDKPKDPPKKPEPLVNDKLSKEFKEQYRYRFGQTEAQEIINSPGRSDEYTYYNSKNDVGIVQYTAYQRSFGEYMGRRLVEYHFDNWAKTSPTIRPVYQLKDRISNLDVQVKKGYKVKWKYNFAGPNMEATIENPFDVQAKVHADMSGIISAPVEVIYTLGYQLNPRWKAEALYKQIDGIYQVVFTRKINPHVNMTFTGSIDTLPAGPVQQQNLALIGLGWTE